jgi:hypothetical protein
MGLTSVGNRALHESFETENSTENLAEIPNTQIKNESFVHNRVRPGGLD